MEGKKNLIIYFSRAGKNYSVGYINKGNTEVIADYIKELTNADTFKIVMKKPYSDNYEECLNETRKEIQKKEKPELEQYLSDITPYDTIFIGCPIYWGGMPLPLVSLLEKLNFEGKTIRLFVTHEGSGLGRTLNELKYLCSGAKILDNALSIQGSTVNLAKDKVESWI